MYMYAKHADVYASVYVYVYVHVDVDAYANSDANDCLSAKAENQSPTRRHVIEALTTNAAQLAKTEVNGQPPTRRLR